jgi:hypothetical protein
LIEKEYLVFKGRRYAYHPISNSVEIEDKEKYDLLDFFKILHEVSHANDYEFMKHFKIIQIIFNIVCFPTYFLVMLFLELSVVFKIVLSIIMIMIAVIKIYLLYHSEKKASDNAFCTLTTLIELKDDDLKRIKQNYVWAYRSQTVESMIFVPLITMIVSVIS